jgi:hypothetical protein
VTLPVASAGGLLFYTQDRHSSEDVLVVNPLTGEHKILGVPTLDNGAPASLEEAQADGDDHENGDDRSEADAEDGSVVVSDESELDKVSDSGRSEWDEEESADDDDEEDADDDDEEEEADDEEEEEADDEEEEDADDDEEEEDADNGHNSLQSRLIHVLQEPEAAAATGRIAPASFQLVMTGRALGIGLREYEAEKSTEVYDFRTDTWTDSGDLCGNLRLAKNSSSADYEGLVLTVAYGPSSGHGLSRAGNPYFLLSYNVGSREWSVYTRIVIPGSSVDYEQPQILSCDGRIFLVTLYVCPTSEGAGPPVAAAEGAAPTAAAGGADEAPAAGAADGFSHQLMIHEFTARTLEFARVSRAFTYISPEAYRELSKCVGTSEGKICCGLDERALAYYDLREEKWTKYPEFEEDEDEEEIRYAGVCYKPSLTARVHW